MKAATPTLLRLLAVIPLALVSVLANAQEENDWFEAKVRPLLVAHCYECHSGVHSKGGLLLDSQQGWSHGSDSGPVVLPGDPENSLLIQAIKYQGLQMPPNGQLADRDIETLVEWVKRGAPDPRQGVPRIGGMDANTAKSWWAFKPLPAAMDSFTPDWIDRQIDQKLQSEGVASSEQGDPRTLVRRISYDLTGLPPSLDEIQRVGQTAEGAERTKAFNDLIESKLGSVDYGVHWGRHWLDVVRYADTAGENTDRPVVNAWRYRNWVFDAFNRDMPYDAMIRYQIAGDLQQGHSEGVVATGFLAIARRFGHDIDKDMHLTYEEIIDTTGTSFLGLTLGCARCHDHKYDPVSAEDYYALYGIFASSKFSFPGCEPKGQPRDMVPLLDAPEVAALMQPWQAKVDAAKIARDAQQQQIQKLRKSLQQLEPSRRELITQSEVAEGAKVAFDSGSSQKSIAVRVGELIQLTVYPNGNHGADSTCIQMNIRQAEGTQLVWTTDQLIEDFSSRNTRKIGPLRVDPLEKDLLQAGWFYLETTTGPDLLTDKKLNNGGNPNIHSWSIGELPSVFANVSDSPADVWTRLPGRSLFVHPGPERPVSVVWVSPMEGVVQIDGFVQDAHPAALDGVSFKLEHVRASESGESLTRMAEILQEPIDEPGPAPSIPEAYAVVEGTPSDAKLHLRGDPDKPGQTVPRRWLSVLGGDPLSEPKASGRGELAQWIAGHPLAARVMVNRVWQWHFGVGLVRTPSDFGSRGEFPTHLELLDQLAAQFVKSGYSIKQLHRWIMATEVYRRASVSTQQQRDADPQNRLLSHFIRRRLTAEEIRDSILLCGGNLDRSVGQEHPFPPPSTWTFTQHDPFNAVYPTNRRSAMMMVQRQRRHPFLALFDGADPNATTAIRQTTLVPTQALYYLNDPFFHEQALSLAQQYVGSDPPVDTVQAIFFRTLQRKASDEEIKAILELIGSYQGSALEAWSAAIRMIMASNEFHFID